MHNTWNHTATAEAEQKAQDAGQVTAELTHLEKLLEEGHQAANRLEQRLHPVLRGSVTEAGKAASAPQPLRVPLADRIVQMQVSAHSLNQRLAMIAESIEI